MFNSGTQLKYYSRQVDLQLNVAVNCCAPNVTQNGQVNTFLKITAEKNGHLILFSWTNFSFTVDTAVLSFVCTGLPDILQPDQSLYFTVMTRRTPTGGGAVVYQSFLLEIEGNFLKFIMLDFANFTIGDQFQVLGTTIACNDFEAN